MHARFPTTADCNEKTTTMEMLLRRDCALCTKGAGSCVLYAGGSEWCAMCAMGAGGYALHVVLFRMLLCILEAVEGELRLLEVSE